MTPVRAVACYEYGFQRKKGGGAVRSFYCQPNGLLASHFESFSIDLTGFRTIGKIYPQL